MVKQINLTELKQPFCLGRRMSSAIAIRFAAGDTIAILADDYAAPQEWIEDALRLEILLQSPSRSMRELLRLLRPYKNAVTVEGKIRALYCAIRYAEYKRLMLPGWVMGAFQECCKELYD